MAQTTYDFTGTDGTTLQAWNAAFTKHTGLSGNLTIQSNAVGPSSATFEDIMYSVDPGSWSVTDYVVQASITPSAGGGVYLGVRSNAASGYYLVAGFFSGQGPLLYRNNANGFNSVFASNWASLGTIPATTFTARLEVSGNDLILSIDGGTQYTQTLTGNDITATGLPCIGISASATTPRLDTLVLDDLQVGGVHPRRLLNTRIINARARAVARF